MIDLAVILESVFVDILIGATVGIEESLDDPTEFLEKYRSGESKLKKLY